MPITKWEREQLLDNMSQAEFKRRERARRDAKILKMIADGAEQRTICDEMGVSNSLISQVRHRAKERG